ncbi:MAG: IS66 family transposase zinc-finger binding domain-containing protein, partial [Clostridium sp.]
MMKNEKQQPIFTENQLNSMSPRDMSQIILLMQKQQQDLKEKQKLMEEKMRELEFMNALLSDRLTLAQRKQFGASSEKYADGHVQMGLFNEAEQEADPEVYEPEMEEVCPSAYKRRKKKGKKEEDLSKFPVTETIEHKLEGEESFCSNCGQELKVVNKEVTKTLKFIPSHFEVTEEITYVYGCPGCGQMVRAEKDIPLLQGSVATPSLVTGIMNAKYVNGMPLDRQR